MTMRITMIQSRMGEAGSVLAAGTVNTVSDAFGAAMVGAGYATDTDRALTPPVSSYTPATAAAVQSLVSGDDIPSVTYNGAGRISGFVSDGVAHTITYPDANTITVTNSLGASRTVAVNSEGRVVAAV